MTNQVTEGGQAPESALDVANRLIEELRAEIAGLKEDKGKLRWDIRIGAASMTCISTEVTVVQVGTVVNMVIREYGGAGVVITQKPA